MISEYFRMTHFGNSDGTDPESAWNLSIELNGHNYWELEQARTVDITQEFFGEVDSVFAPTDFPFADHLLHVHSPRMQNVFMSFGVLIQYLPITIKSSLDAKTVNGYAIANYLEVADCLDRKKSKFEIWTKDNLMFWEERKWMLGTYRDITKLVIDRTATGGRLAFWLQGSTSFIVHKSIHAALQEIDVKGCRFVPLEVGAG
jgi:hypothetical protein